jgi:YVTN family beta-propeller protein
MRFLCFVCAFVVSSAAFADTLVVLNKAEATASLIDLPTEKVVATLPTGQGPHEVSVSPDGRLALGGNYGMRDAPGSSLTLIDIPAARVVKTIDLGEYQRPHGIQWRADGRHAVVTAEAQKAVLLVDVEAGEVVEVIETQQETSHMVAVTPDGSRAFVANIGSGSVTALDLSGRKVLAHISTGAGTEGIDVTPDGRQVWVTSREADTVSVLDASSLEILASLPSASFPIRAKITPDGRHVLVSNARSADVAVFDTSTRTEVRRISMSLEAADTEGRLFGDQFGTSSVPIGIVVHPGGKRAYVAHAGADRISVLDLESWEVVGSLTAGKEPDGMAYSPLSVGPTAR